LRLDPARFHVESTHIQLDQPGDSINPRVAETNSEAVYGLAEFFVRGVGGASVAGTRETFHGLQLFNWLYKLDSGVNVSTQAFVSHNKSVYDLIDYGADSKSKWKEPGIGYVGFKFNDGTGWHYGWARIKKGREPRNFFELLDYAYGGVDEPIRTGQKHSRGQTPTQGSLGLLALGATGLLAWRKARAVGAGVADPGR
jgi:hypothetical protein